MNSDGAQTSDAVRQGAAAYERYLRRMDASMRQKVALTAAHLLCEGEVADMGMGSGSGSFALASLYPSLSVVGVDNDPAMVARARERYRLPNLRFAEGDMAQPCFEAGSLEAILNSSVLHHVTSFGGYDRQAAFGALAAQVDQLSEHGVLVVRDFLDPGPGQVWLDLPTNDGTHPTEEDDPTADPQHCSSAALCERFAQEFRSLQPEPESRGFALTRVAGTKDCPLRADHRRYELSWTHAVEFVLRKDYRSDWACEAREEYTFATQPSFEAMFARLGLRVLASTPIRNPWILANRFRGHFELRDTTGRALDFPATNYVIVGQRVPPGEGVLLVEGRAASPRGYLELSHYRHQDTDRVYDLVRRPNTTIDVVPWYREGSGLHVLARRSYPRPILACERRASTCIGGATAAGYVTEPLNVQQGDKPLGQTVEELLGDFPDIGPDGIVAFAPGTEYYPSPGGVQEQVRSVLVEIQPVHVQCRMHNVSGLSTSGVLRAIEARQLLRAAQVGALPEARLETNVYDLLLRQGLDPGPWIGEHIELPAGEGLQRPTRMAALAARPRRRQFRPATATDSEGFLEVCCAEFRELDASGQEVASKVLEFVRPRPLSINTTALALLRVHRGEVYLGIDDDDLPAAQCFRGNSDLLVAPAWRLPREIGGIEQSRRWVTERLASEYGLRCGPIWELGGRYHPSPGVTPEVVHPLAIHVAAEEPATRQLAWVPLADAIAQREQLHDGHLRIVALRAAHALGVLAEGAQRK